MYFEEYFKPVTEIKSVYSTAVFNTVAQHLIS